MNKQAEKPLLEKTIDKICMELPEGFEVSLCIELGAAWIEMVDDRGKQYELPDTADKTLAEQMIDALDLAMDYKRSSEDD